MSYYQDILKELKQQIPEFEYNGINKEDIYIVFTFFSAFIVDNIDDEDLLKRTAGLINKMCMIDDIDVMSLLDEIALTLYDNGCYDIMRRKLSVNAVEYFDETINIWKKGNNL